MKKRILTGAAVAALGGLALFGLASCGEQGSSVSDGGKVLNIRVWNDEFISRFRDYYPEIKSEDKKNEQFTLKDGRKCILRPNGPDLAEPMLEYLKATAGETEFLLRYPEYLPVRFRIRKRSVNSMIRRQMISHRRMVR